MADWDSASFNSENRVRITELVKIADLRKNRKFKNYRYFKNLQKFAQVWLPIYKDGKPLVGQNGKPVNIPFNVTNFDPETESFDETKTCPFVKASEVIRSHIKDEKAASQFKPQVGFYAHAIDRHLQENPDKKGKPSKKERQTGFKESLDSDSFTPVEIHILNYSVGQHLESFKETNTVVIKDKKGNKKKVEKSVADPKYGKDVMLKYDESAKGTSKYKAQAGDRTPITEEEEAYLTWDIISALKETTLSAKDAKVEADRLLKEFLKSVKKKKSSDDDEDEDEDDDLPEDIEEDDDEVTSKKSNKKKTTKKKKDEDEDEEDLDDEEEDLEDEDEDEEEEKSSKKKASSKKSSKSADKKKTSKKKKDEDEDEDLDDDDDVDIDLDDDEEEDDDDD